MKRRAFHLGILASALFMAGSLSAQSMRIDVSGVGARQVPLALAPFNGAGQAPQQLDVVIREDLQRSGMFRLVNLTETLSENSPLDMSALRGQGADSVLVGSVQPVANARLEFRYKLADTVRQSVITEATMTAGESDVRLAGHRIADIVYEKLTGIKGIFSTRIAFVTKQGNRYRLNVADWDGQNVQTALNAGEPIISPAWSPDGKFLYFTSDRGGAPQIYRMPSNGGAASRVTFGSSYNVSPRISPDGQQMAYVTQRNGRFLIALKDLQSGDETLLTDTGEEESPSFAPNGQWVMYTTRAGGREYLMAVSTDGRVKQRLSSSTSSVREPAWGPYTW